MTARGWGSCLLLWLGLLATPLPADEASHRQSAEELLAIMDLEERAAELGQTLD